jgi:hypothetical protein
MKNPGPKLIHGIFTGMIKKHILKGTEEALERISEKVSRAKLITTDQKVPVACLKISTH